MIFVAGIDKKYIITALAIIVIAVPLTYNFLLPAHAKQRIDTFLHPESDPRGAGYNVLQSKLAIGAGQVTGCCEYAGLHYGHGNQIPAGNLASGSPPLTSIVHARNSRHSECNCINQRQMCRVV